MSRRKQDIAQMVQSQFKKIGIDIKIRSVEYAEFSKILGKTGDYDLLLCYNQGRSHPLSFLVQYFSLNTLFGGINYYENQNKTLESISIDARNAVSEDERDRYLCQVCSILYEEAGVIPLVYELEYALMNNKVKGFEFGPSANVYGLDHLEECWIE